MSSHLWIFELWAVVQDYSLSIGVFIASLIALRLFEILIVNNLKKLSAKTKNEIDDVIIAALDEVGLFFYIVISIYVAAQFVDIPQKVARVISLITITLVTFYTVKGLQRFIDYGAGVISRRRAALGTSEDTALLDVLRRVSRAALWVLAAVLILANLGYDVTALVTGLGIGGVAVAIALQSVLADFFAAFTIYFDKPFQPGDFIVLGASERGVVKTIGIKSTRIETIEGHELVVSNKDLTDSRVHNYKEAKRRRIQFDFGVNYNTAPEKLKKIPKIVTKIIKEVPEAHDARVTFISFGDSTLKFEVVYYLIVSDYREFRRIWKGSQHSINIQILEEFRKEKIEMAFPTRTVHLIK